MPYYTTNFYNINVNQNIELFIGLWVAFKNPNILYKEILGEK